MILNMKIHQSKSSCQISRCRGVCVGLILILSSYAADAWAAPADGHLLLAGGSLSVCSSVNRSACRTDVAWPSQAMKGRAFSVETGAIRRLHTALEPHMPPDMLRQLVLALMQMASVAPQNLSQADLTRLFRALDFQVESSAQLLSGRTGADRRVVVDGEAIYQGLSDRHWNAVLDHMEIMPPSATGRRRVEHVDIKASRSEAAVDIYTRFVAMARAASGRATPRIAISTAASRDPYDAIDYYQGIFEQLGAEVTWLPLDAAVARARRAGQCDRLADWQARVQGAFERDRIHPQRYAAQQDFCLKDNAGPTLLEQSDGLFLNGGDQWLTLNAFGPVGSREPEFEILAERLEHGRMVLGGTSAGTAVQAAGVMISNGDSATALIESGFNRPPPPAGCDRDASCPDGLTSGSLTWHEGGGLSTFAPGVVDTHFSERNRQFRLLQLLALTGQRLGWGIDEATALEAIRAGDSDDLVLRVHGTGAVWMLDTGQAVVERTRPLAISGVRAARLLAGRAYRFAPEQGLISDDGVHWPEALRNEGVQNSDCRSARRFDSFSQAIDHALDEAGTNEMVCVSLPIQAGSYAWRLREIPRQDPSGRTRGTGFFIVDAGPEKRYRQNSANKEPPPKLDH